VIEAKANELLEARLSGAKRIPHAQALRAATTHRHNYLTTYVNDLGSVIDMDMIRSAKLHLGVDPLGGAGVHYWARIAEVHELDLTVVDGTVDPTFRFMTWMRWPDSYGSVFALCDATTDWHEGSI